MPNQASNEKSHDAALGRLDQLQEHIQNARFQETKDSMLCHTVVLLSQYAPDSVREKALELLRVYNSSERIH